MNPSWLELTEIHDVFVNRIRTVLSQLNDDNLKLETMQNYLLFMHELWQHIQFEEDTILIRWAEWANEMKTPAMFRSQNYEHDHRLLKEVAEQNLKLLLFNEDAFYNKYSLNQLLDLLGHHDERETKGVYRLIYPYLQRFEMDEIFTHFNQSKQINSTWNNIQIAEIITVANSIKINKKITENLNNFSTNLLNENQLKILVKMKQLTHDNSKLISLLISLIKLQFKS